MLAWQKHLRLTLLRKCLKDRPSTESLRSFLRKSFIKPRNIKTLVTSAQNENLSTENEVNLLKVECRKLAKKSYEAVKCDLDFAIEVNTMMNLPE